MIAPVESGAWPERHGTWTPLVAARSRWAVMEPEMTSPLTAAGRLNEKEKGCFLAAATEPAAAAGLSKN